VSDPLLEPADAGEPAVDPAAYVDLWSRRCNAMHGEADHPINCVDFAAAEAFCKSAGKRLPTEVEWDFAARGMEARTCAWGNEPPKCGRACYDKNESCRLVGEAVATCPSGLHPADRTPEGVFDLGGNVREWVSGVSALATQRVLRGASFYDGAEKLRADYREVVPSTTSHPTIGFRCALDAPTQPGP
jgi:serine/threonine-protein kinase